MKKRLRKIVLLFVATLLTLPVCAAVNDTTSMEETESTDTVEEVNGEMDWEPVMNAIIQVESEGNPQRPSWFICRRNADHSDLGGRM